MLLPVVVNPSAGRPHLVKYLASLGETELSAYCSGVLAQHGAFDRAVGDDAIPEGYNPAKRWVEVTREPEPVGEGQRRCSRCHRVKVLRLFIDGNQRCRVCEAATVPLSA